MKSQDQEKTWDQGTTWVKDHLWWNVPDRTRTFTALGNNYAATCISNCENNSQM